MLFVLAKGADAGPADGLKLFYGPVLWDLLHARQTLLGDATKPLA